MGRDISFDGGGGFEKKHRMVGEGCPPCPRTMENPELCAYSSEYWTSVRLDLHSLWPISVTVEKGASDRIF